MFTVRPALRLVKTQKQWFRHHLNAIDISLWNLQYSSQVQKKIRPIRLQEGLDRLGFATTNSGLVRKSEYRTHVEQLPAQRRLRCSSCAGRGLRARSILSVVA